MLLVGDQQKAAVLHVKASLTSDHAGVVDGGGPLELVPTAVGIDLLPQVDHLAVAPQVGEQQCRVQTRDSGLHPKFESRIPSLTPANPESFANRAGYAPLGWPMSSICQVHIPAG